MIDKLLLVHGHLLVDDQKEYLDGAIAITGDKISGVYPSSNKLPKDLESYKTIDLKGRIVMPGFFDTHTHGIGGVSFNDIEGDMEKASSVFIKNGVTSFLVSLTGKEVCPLLEKYEDISVQGFRGIHLEGPFLNPERCGAIDPEGLSAMDVSLLERYLSCSSKIRQMTLAPELEGSDKVISFLKEKDIKVMFGHSLALMGQISNLPQDGITHLYNAMLPFSHRDLSLVNEAFLTDGLYCELICDGFHIDPDVLRFTLSNLNRKRVIVISDSTLAAGLENGEYVFENRKVKKEGIRFTRADDGVIAGSVTTVKDEVQLLHKIGVDNCDLVAFSSLNAARFYGLDRQIGSIFKGHMADLVILDEDFSLEYILTGGKVYHA